jgi:hypothetical protein
MAEAVRKDTRWKSVVSNSRAIHGALAECLRLSDQLSNVELKSETILFVNAMEYLCNSLLKQRRRFGLVRPSEHELLTKLRGETLHIRELVEASEQIANEFEDEEAKRFVAQLLVRVIRFTETIDRKGR